MEDIITSDAFDDPIEAAEEVRAPEPVDIVSALEEMVNSPNLTEMLPEEKLTEISRLVLDEFELDEMSREDWLESAEKGLELAALVTKEKHYPFEGAANIRYPLIASGAMQFNARALPALVPAGDIVKMPVQGKDDQGKKAARSDRVSSYMSHYLRKKISGWDEDTDKLLIQLPIVGQMFRKVWWDPARQAVRTRLLGPDIVVVNQATKNISEAPRISEKLFLYPNEILERQRTGLFKDLDLSSYQGERDDDSNIEVSADATEDSLAPQEFIEQHRWLDLDDDGYMEPYVVTVHRVSRQVVRVVANFTANDVKFLDGTTLADALVDRERRSDEALDIAGFQIALPEPEREVASIKRRGCYISYRFLPPFDGSFYGVGLGYLLCTHSQAIDGIINMLIDTGHMASTTGGFFGRGLNTKKSELWFRPGEWKAINVPGDDIRKAIIPLPKSEPSPTLFNMLSLLIDAGKEVSSVNDAMTGDTPSQVQPTVMMAKIEQGMAVFAASFKRIYQSMTAEFSLFASLMSLYPDEESYARYHELDQRPQMAIQGQLAAAVAAQGGQMPAPAEQITMAADFDFDDMDIEPSSDPRSVTKPQQMAQAQLLMEMADAGKIPQEKATRRVLEAAGVPDIDSLLPTDQERQAQAQAAQAQAQLQQAVVQADIAEKQAKAQHDGAQAQAVQLELQLKQADTGSQVEKRRAETAQIVEEMQRGSDPLAEQRLMLDEQKLRFDARKAELELVNAERERAHGERTQDVQFNQILAKAGFAPGTTPEVAGENMQQVMQIVAQTAAQTQEMLRQNEEAQRARDEQLMRVLMAPTEVERDEKGRAVRSRRRLETE